MANGLMQDPKEMGFWDAAWQSKLKKWGLLDHYNKQQGRQKAVELVGKKSSPYQFDESEQFDSMDTPYQALQRGLPDANPLDAQGNPIFGEEQVAQGQAANQAALDKPSLMNAGTGLLGGKINPAEFYGGLMGTQGYEGMGNAGLMNIQNNAQAMQAASAQNAYDKSLMSGQFKSYDQKLKARQALRKEMTPQLAPSRESLRKYNQATDIIKKRKGFAGMTGADDTVLIKAFASMILPGEAVMEGDIGAIINQAGVPGWLKSFIQKVQGEGQLGKTERSRIYNTMTSLAERANTENIDIRGILNTDIKAGGFNPEGLFRAPLKFKPYAGKAAARPEGFN